MNLFNIAILVPTHARPIRFKEMYDSIMNNTQYRSCITFYVGMDTDDITMQDYPRTLPNTKWSYFPSEKQGCVPDILEGLAADAVQDGQDLLVILADDVILKTPRWDVLLQTHFQVQPTVVGYFNDGNNRNKGEHLILHREYLHILGKLCPIQFEHFCIDEWICDVAKRINKLTFFNEIIFEHKHFKYGKAEKDTTYKLKREDSVDKDGLSMSDRDIIKYKQNAQLRIKLAEQLKDDLIPF